MSNHKFIIELEFDGPVLDVQTVVNNIASAITNQIENGAGIAPEDEECVTKELTIMDTDGYVRANRLYKL